MAPLENKPSSSGSSTDVLYKGTGPDGRMLDPVRDKDRRTAKKAGPREGASATGQPRPKLVVKGSFVKSNVVLRHMDNVGTLVFKGRVASLPSRAGSAAKSLDTPKGDDAGNGDIVVEKDIVQTSVCETMTTHGLIFEGDDDEPVASKGAAGLDVSSAAFQKALAEQMDRVMELRYGFQLEQE